MRWRRLPGLTWRRGGEIVHNKDRPFSRRSARNQSAVRAVGEPAQYLGRTYLGQRTAGYQAALGCRFRCTFCGVATMFRGKTALPTAARLRAGPDGSEASPRRGLHPVLRSQLLRPRSGHGAAARGAGELQLPWWCFARVGCAAESVGHLLGAGQEEPAAHGLHRRGISDDELLHDIRKGTRTDQTLAAVEKCRSHGVIPELSFMLAPPQDPEGETERTFEFIREIKRIHPRTEIMIYIYTPIPTSSHSAKSRASRSVAPLLDAEGKAVVFPRSVDEWSAPEWVNYWCHTDAPWLTRRLRRRISDFTTVLGCRFPTITDIRSPPIGKATLRALASWRYRFQKYNRPWELDLSQRIIRLHNPRASSL